MFERGQEGFWVVRNWQLDSLKKGGFDGYQVTVTLIVVLCVSPAALLVPVTVIIG